MLQSHRREARYQGEVERGNHPPVVFIMPRFAVSHRRGTALLCACTCLGFDTIKPPSNSMPARLYSLLPGGGKALGEPRGTAQIFWDSAHIQYQSWKGYTAHDQATAEPPGKAAQEGILKTVAGPAFHRAAAR